MVTHLIDIDWFVITNMEFIHGQVYLKKYFQKSEKHIDLGVRSATIRASKITHKPVKKVE